MSVLIANVALPIWAARNRGGRRGFRKLLVATLLFNVAYLTALLVLYPRL